MKEIKKADELQKGKYYHVYKNGKHWIITKSHDLKAMVLLGSPLNVVGPIELPTLEDIEAMCDE